MVCVGVFVLGGLAWASINRYVSNPWLFGSLAIGCVAVIALLLAQGLGVFGLPKQGEPTAVNLLAIKQLGMFYATGMQQPRNMEELVRECLGMRDLPLPAGIVDGEAKDRANWREVTPEEAARIAHDDQAKISQKLREFAASLVGEAVEKSLVWAPQKAAVNSSGPSPADSKESKGT